MSASATIAISLLCCSLFVKGETEYQACSILNVQLSNENYALNIPWMGEIRFTRNVFSGVSPWIVTSKKDLEDTYMAGRSPSQRFLMVGSILAGLGVAAGAFGAHALKEILDAPMLQVFETATRYVMYHAFGLCIVSLAIDRYPEQRLEKSGWLFLIGMFLFSGSLYVVSLAGIRWVGAVTPIGGLAFMAGWMLLGWGAWRGALHRATSRTF